MTSVKIYHNPRCSKSRQTLALLEENDVEAEVVLYLESPPTAQEITDILGKLGLSLKDIVRTGEAAYKEQNLGDASVSDEQLIEAIVETPILLQRPIVVAGNAARIGRPPESVLEII